MNAIVFEPDVNKRFTNTIPASFLLTKRVVFFSLKEAMTVMTYARHDVAALSKNDAGCNIYAAILRIPTLQGILTDFVLQH